ncbi:MAG: hypothetical protein JWM78_2532 [Verrucomicrobiaceae bacterium]|nr:hypothetical protein [Verrucomicrobiaceae bacterium]
MSRDQQIESLRKMASRSVMRWLFWSCVVGAALCVVAGFNAGGIGFYILAVFLVFIALVASRAQPHIQRAAKAIDSPLRSTLSIIIEITEWSDSPTYHAVIANPDTGSWRMEFIPQYWKPVAGTLAINAHFVPGIEWPALLVADEAIIYPREKPQKIN